MKLQLLDRARKDIQHIRGHLKTRSPDGLQGVLADITRCFRSIESQPLAGRETPLDHVYERVSVKYHYLIPYLIRGDTITVLRVYDTRRQDYDYSTLLGGDKEE
ncbi:MAG: type II toxin-antitoxin system RelE/ParE family toxin [Gammaproteobacteria bacterium]|nr:type II toxin-antitoxin system RelE/ParE family toxin [Gammaproteobacteria bacterium]